MNDAAFFLNEVITRGSIVARLESLILRCLCAMSDLLPSGTLKSSTSAMSVRVQNS